MPTNQLFNYFYNLIMHDYGNAYLKNKIDREVKISYYKCWLQDMNDTLILNNINIQQFKLKLNENL